MANDARLVTAALTGDLSASEDVAQETFLTGLAGLREPGRLRAWLCTGARDLSAAWLRRRSAVRPRVSLAACPPGPRHRT